MNRKGPTGTYAAPAAEKAFEILRLLGDHHAGLTIKEMSIALQRSLGELFRIVIVMERLGYLQKSIVTDRYTVAYKLLEMVLRATPAQNLVHAAVPEMQVLARDTAQSCHLVVANGASGLVVAREEGPGTRGFALRVGGSIDLLTSCSGHVLIAFAAPDQAERIIELARAGRGQAVDERHLADELTKVREQGYAMRKSPITFGVTDISHPLFGYDGGLAGALTIPFLELIDGSQKVDLAAAQARLAMAAERISDRLGHPPPMEQQA